MKLTQGTASALCIGFGLLAGVVLDEIAWGLIVGAAAGGLVEAWSMSRHRRP